MPEPVDGTDPGRLTVLPRERGTSLAKAVRVTFPYSSPRVSTFTASALVRRFPAVEGEG